MNPVVTRLLLSLLLTAITAPRGLTAPKPTPSDNPCQQCLLGPVELAIDKGTPRSYRKRFSADPQDDYTLVVEQLGQPTVAALIQLNGRILLHFKQPISNSGPHFFPVSLGSFNRFHVVIKGLRGGRIRIVLVRTSSLPPSSLPPSRQACGARMEWFTHYPAYLSLIRSIVPLGSLNPPSHTLPTHHIYLSTVLTDPSDPTSQPIPVDVFAPGRVEVVAVVRNGPEDFDIQMQPCRDVRTYYFHLRTLDRAIEDELRTDGWFCFGPCAQRTSIVVNDGQRLGTAPTADSIGFDWGLIDRRLPPLPFANSARYDFSYFSTLRSLPPELVALAPYIAPERPQQFCPADYLVPALRTAAFRALFGSVDGGTRRTAPPICGEHEQDQPGTAQGNWFLGPTATAFEEDDTTLALVHDNVNPGVPMFSVSQAFCDPGGTTCAWSTGKRDFMPADTGLVNRDFADVVPGAIYCYENLTLQPISVPDTQIGRVLVEVFGGSADRLRIEPVAPTVATECGTAPWSFGSGVREFQR